jgi:hypothetical protein
MRVAENSTDVFMTMFQIQLLPNCDKENPTWRASSTSIIHHHVALGLNLLSFSEELQGKISTHAFDNAMNCHNCMFTTPAESFTDIGGNLLGPCRCIFDVSSLTAHRSAPS